MLHVYYGMGKGKTSTLNGSAIRARGAGLKVLIIRFLKGRETSEDEQLKKLGVKIFKAQKSEKFVFEMDSFEKLETRDLSKQYMKFARLNDRNYDLIILDEFLDLAAKNVNMFTANQMLEFLDNLKSEVMISGHTYIQPIFAKADLITKFKDEKHYFNEGFEARKGIEF